VTSGSLPGTTRSIGAVGGSALVTHRGAVVSAGPGGLSTGPHRASSEAARLSHAAPRWLGGHRADMPRMAERLGRLMTRKNVGDTYETKTQLPVSPGAEKIRQRRLRGTGS
jgi:hypothetical protein